MKSTNDVVRTIESPGDIVGRVHSIETCGTVDGPGIRYIVFTQGCPMRCQYCHNPDTWDLNGKDAAQITVKELMKDVKKYKSFMNASGGGITVSGGEPLLQPAFVAALFAACKKEGISTALDTSGFADLAIAKTVLENTDLVLLDIKSIHPVTFKSITGREISPTMQLADYLSEKGIPVWIRFVLVPGLSDNVDEIDQLAQYIAALNNVEKVEILPFHKMGEYKWEELGYRYKLKDTPEPDAKQIEMVKDIFSKRGVTVR